MTQKEMIEKYKEIISTDLIEYSSASRHFKSIKKAFNIFQEGIAKEDNFFDNTIALFEQVDKPKRKPDFISLSGSKYWYYKKGLIRGADHWGNRISNCNWAIKLKNGRTAYGYSAWSTAQFKEEIYGYVDWKDFILKPQLFEIKKKEVLTTFNNKIGRDIVIIGNKKYQAIPKIIWKEID